MKSSFDIWKILTWILVTITAIWFITTGYWTISLTQEISESWIGQPESIPFIPFLDTHVLVAPFVPFYAIFNSGDWMPLILMFICGGGTSVLWQITKKARFKAYLED